MLQTDSRTRTVDPLLTIKSRAVAEGCRRLRNGLFERLSARVNLRPTAAGCARSAPQMLLLAGLSSAPNGTGGDPDLDLLIIEDG